MSGVGALNSRIFFILMMMSLLFFSVVITGCSSLNPDVHQSVGNASVRELSPLTTPPIQDRTHDLAIGETAIISSPEGILNVTVREFNVTTGKILIEEKNVGTYTVQYNPAIWLRDGEGVNYTIVYCHADSCPGYVFFNTLPFQGTENRILGNLYADFRIPERGRQGKLMLYWSDFGQEASWILIPG
jgi:hypothetical protein